MSVGRMMVRGVAARMVSLIRNGDMEILSGYAGKSMLMVVFSISPVLSMLRGRGL
jgi:hypothetical protein